MSFEMIARRILCSLSILLTALAVPVLAQTNTAAFSFPDRGGESQTTSGVSPNLTVGYARINETAAIAAGFAVFDYKANNVLVSEATVPAAALVNDGRIFAEIGGGVDTGIAIMNANDEPVEIGFYFTDAGGRAFGQDVLMLPARGQISRFLSQEPFDGGSPLFGTFTFFTLRDSPNVRVSAIALRGFVNERGEFLMTTLPVTPVGQRGLFGGSTLPQFAAGGGWMTQVVLVNTTLTELAGTITFTDQAGQAVPVNSDIGTASIFSYRVAANSAFRLQTSNTGELLVGSVRIATAVPGTDIPVGLIIFSFHSDGVTVSSAAVPAVRPASATRMFVEAQGQTPFQPGSLRTGLAVSNADSSVPVRVSFDLTTTTGQSTGLHGELDLPPGGQVTRFLNEIPGFESVPIPFQGVLRISADVSSLTVTGLRGRYNERGEFLVTTVPAVNENDDYFNNVLRYSNFTFPHIADGGGYRTQFVLFSGWSPGAVNGTLDFFNQAGQAFPLTLGVLGIGR